MAGIMQNLYNGALYPAEQIVSRDAEYIKAIREQGDLMQQLEEKLAPEDYKIVEEVCDLDAIAHDRQLFEFFSRGLSLGLGLMQEAQEYLHASEQSADKV